MSDRPEFGADVNWRELAEQFSEITSHMTHHEEQQYNGHAFYAEVLRRLVTGPYGRRWLTTNAEAKYLIESHTIVTRLALEDAKKDAKRAREGARQGFREHAHQLADWIRGVVNDRTVPSRYRREGALTVADWIDPQVEASPFSRVQDGAA